MMVVLTSIATSDDQGASRDTIYMNPLSTTYKTHNGGEIR